MNNNNFIEKIIQRIKRWYSVLPDKKKYFELVTAVLSVPMIVTVIIVNLNSINRSKQTTTATITSAPIQVVVEAPASSSGNINPPKDDKQPKITPTVAPTATPTSIACKQGVGEVEISSPQEDEVITSDNVCIIISTDSDYCGVTWSYKLDNGDWSGFSNQNICLYNLSAGKKNLQVKIKSNVVDKTVTLARDFTYKTAITPTVTPTATPTK